MSRAKVAIAHDYLTQRGGAERVVLTLLKAFPEATVHTTLYDPEGTYPEFADAKVVTSPLNRVGALRRDHRRALPLLAPAASRPGSTPDVTIVSSSGWAHGFDIPGRSIVYCYSPARWLYQSDALPRRSGQPRPSALRPHGTAPRPGPLGQAGGRSRSDRYLAISEVVRERIRRRTASTRTSSPPPTAWTQPLRRSRSPSSLDWQDGYLLLVSRLLPYKNVDVAIDAARQSGRRLVIIGRGPEEARLRAALPINVRMLNGLTDEQMRWAYAHADVLVAPSHEDFGLTPLEAAAFGVPTVALRGGGYLDTILDGETGLFFDRPSSGGHRLGSGHFRPSRLGR